MATNVRQSTVYSDNQVGKSIYGSTARDSVAHNNMLPKTASTTNKNGRTTTMKGKGGASGFVGLMRTSKKGFDAHNEEVSDDDEFWNPDDPRNQTRVIVDKNKTLKWFWHQFRLNCYYLAEHSTFDYAILGVIVLNSIMISLQTVDKLKYCHPFMRDPAIEHLFVKQLEVYFFYVYLFECVVKITGLGVIEYFKSGMNIFDFFLIVAGCEWVDIISQFVYSPLKK